MKGGEVLANYTWKGKLPVSNVHLWTLWLANLLFVSSCLGSFGLLTVYFTKVAATMLYHMCIMCYFSLFVISYCLILHCWMYNLAQWIIVWGISWLLQGVALLNMLLLKKQTGQLELCTTNILCLGWVILPVEQFDILDCVNYSYLSSLGTCSGTSKICWWRTWTSW